VITRFARSEPSSLLPETSKTSAHTVALVILEASDQLSHERLHRLTATSLPQLARFRSRLVAKPLGLGQPVWAEIDDYDPSAQMHRAVVRSPGGPREFAELIAQLGTQRHRRQPLWEAWSIEGLAGRRWALAVKVSPVLNERGDAAASVWSRLLSSGKHDDSARMPPEPSLGSAPSLGELVGDLVTEIVETQVTATWVAAGAAIGALQAFRRRPRSTGRPGRAAQAVTSTTGRVPRTVFNAPSTPRRALAFASIPLADVQTVSKAFGGSTVNVLLAACTLSLRAYLEHSGSLPTAPLLVRVPFSTPASDPLTPENSLGVGLVRLPVQLVDPIQILTDLHTATERLTTACRDELENASAVGDFTTLMSLAPAAATDAAAQLYARLGMGRLNAPACHGSVSYMSGNSAAYCAGAKVVGMHIAAPLSEGGFNIALTSRNDAIDLCMCVCPDNVSRVDDLVAGIAGAVDLLVTAAHKSPRGHGRSVVTELTSHLDKRAHTRASRRR
jgi:diacylglycerol O-acyltransferase / wax synthase